MKKKNSPGFLRGIKKIKRETGIEPVSTRGSPHHGLAPCGRACGVV